MSDQHEIRSYLAQSVPPILAREPFSPMLVVPVFPSWASSQHTPPFPKGSVEWVTVTHPHHPLHGQRVQLIRVRRGPDPDLIIRMPDGYHGAIAASLTDYAGTPEADPSSTEPPLLSLEGLWQMAQFIEQHRHLHPLPEGDEI